MAGRWLQNASDAHALGFGATIGHLSARATWDAVAGALSNSKPTVAAASAVQPAHQPPVVTEGVLHKRGEAPPTLVAAPTALADPAGLVYAPVVYQNQRYRPLYGWKAPSLPTDRHEWTNETGHVRLAAAVQVGSAEVTAGFTLPYVLVVEAGRTDEQGWQYAFDFPAEYRAANYTAACVRRREWRRIDVAQAS